MGEWRTEKLGKIAKIEKGDGLTSSEMIEGEFPVIAGGLSYCGFHNSFNRNEDTITVSASGVNAGTILFHKTKIFATDCTSIEWDYSQEYLYYSLLKRQNELIAMQTGLAQPHVYPKDIAKIDLFYPTSLEEQRRIAAVLSSVDEAISASRLLAEKYTAIKQGLMQDLLGKGEKVELDSVVTINPYYYANLPDRFYYIDLESVISGKLINNTIVKLEDAPSRAQRLLQPKDIIFQTVRPYQQNNYFFSQESELPTVASTGYAQIRTSYNPRYIYYVLHENDFVREVINRCTGSNYPAINPKELKKCNIKFISDINEQEKIADILSSADERINAEQEHLAKLENIKKGLMEDLLTNKVKCQISIY